MNKQIERDEPGRGQAPPVPYDKPGRGQAPPVPYSMRDEPGRPQGSPVQYSMRDEPGRGQAPPVPYDEPGRGQAPPVPCTMPETGPYRVGAGLVPALELPPLIVVLGPTASGKSTLGIELARRFHGEIVSADSRQVYRGLDIGAAKVTIEEQALARHHLLDVADPREVYTVARFQQEAFAAINDIRARGSLPLLVGGSPHYIQAVVDHLHMPRIEPQPELRAQLEARPLAELLAQLAELDAQSAASIDRNNARRVIRALEVCLVSGQPFSQQRGVADPLYRSLLLGISWPREVLYARIDARVDERIEQGMVQETRDLLVQGVSHARLDSLGLEYRYTSRLLRGEFASEAEMAQRLKYAIHDFTRRQLTWFRKDKRIVWLEGMDVEKASECISGFVGEGIGNEGDRKGLHR